MNDRDRMIELIIKSGASFERALPEEVADYLLANGVIVPPCKVGDTVYRLAYNKDRNEYRIADLWEVVKMEIYEDEVGIIDDSDNYFTIGDVGKTVFLTKEEAEQALKERKQDGC